MKNIESLLKGVELISYIIENMFIPTLRGAFNGVTAVIITVAVAVASEVIKCRVYLLPYQLFHCHFNRETRLWFKQQDNKAHSKEEDVGIGHFSLQKACN